VAAFEIRRDPLTGFPYPAKKSWPNPNAPAIDPRTGGVGSAVIFLRGIDLERARPWDHPPVRVEMRESRFHVCQGQADAQTGFVRRGDGVEMISHDTVYHSLHAGGAAFFTLPFLETDRSSCRRLDDGGVVELMSGAGSYWMRAYLFVADHPYFTRTDAEGRFVLAEVPTGQYEVVCWMPNWRKARHERDSESGVICRLFFEAPVERTRQIILASQETREVDFSLSIADFERSPEK
jgi:hypothetical protein